MGAKNFLPRFNATSGTSPDIGSNTLTIHGEVSSSGIKSWTYKKSAGIKDAARYSST